MLRDFGEYAISNGLEVLRNELLSGEGLGVREDTHRV
jgi:hypothetical protein